MRAYFQAEIWCYVDNQVVALPISSINYAPQSVTLSNGTWNGMATILQPGSGLAFAVDDGSGHTGVSGAFAVLTNRIPVANSISVLVTEDTPKDITLTGSDPENDPITFGIATQ